MVTVKKEIHARRGSEKQHKEGKLHTKQENTERKNAGRTKRQEIKWEGKNKVQKIGGKEEEGLKYSNSLAFLAP